jgi:DNA-binding NtrC family response regulator
MSLYTPVPFQPISAQRARTLARFFAFKHARAKELPARPLTKDAEDLVASYAWLDDLPSLSATIRNAVIMAEGAEVGSDVIRLPEARPNRTDADDWDRVEEAVRTLMGQSLAELEREHILLTLECCRGNRILAAEVLGISIRTMRNKLKKFTQDGMPIARPASPSKHHRPRAEQVAFAT